MMKNHQLQIFLTLVCTKYITFIATRLIGKMKNSILPLTYDPLIAR